MSSSSTSYAQAASGGGGGGGVNYGAARPLEPSSSSELRDVDIAGFSGSKSSFDYNNKDQANAFTVPMRGRPYDANEAFDSARSRRERRILSWLVGLGGGTLLAGALLFAALGVVSGVTNIVNAAQQSSGFGIFVASVLFVVDLTLHSMGIIAGLSGVVAALWGLRWLPRAERRAGETGDQAPLHHAVFRRNEWSQAYVLFLSLSIGAYAIATFARWAPLVVNVLAAAGAMAQQRTVMDLAGTAVSLLSALASLGALLTLVSVWWALALANTQQASRDSFALKQLPLLGAPGGAEAYHAAAERFRAASTATPVTPAAAASQQPQSAYA